MTSYWKNNNVTKIEDFALLTNIVHEEWTGLNIQQHKQLKGIGKHNLRDHMTEAELIFTALAEFSTRQIAEADGASGVIENAEAGKKGGNVARNARIALESKTGKRVVTGKNFLPEKKQKK